MLARIGELAAQEFRLDAHGFLEIGGVNQLAGVFESRPHVLLGEIQRLLGDFGTRARHRRHRLGGGIEEHTERLLSLVDGLFGQIAQFRRNFQLRFNHGRPPIPGGRYHISGCCLRRIAGFIAPATPVRLKGRIGRSAARNLRGDMECQKNRRHADKPENLIHRKHRSPLLSPTPPPRPASIPPLHRMLIRCQHLVGVGRPRDGEQRQYRDDSQRFHDGDGRF